MTRRFPLSLSFGLALVPCGFVHAQGSVPELIGSFPNIVVPPGNPQTPEKILLGQALFFEEQLSFDDTMACATCHLPEGGGGDPRGNSRAPGDDGVMNTLDDEFGSLGVLAQDAQGDYFHDAIFGVARQVTGRNSPSVINAVFFNTQFWDSRARPEFLDLAGNVVLPEFASLESQAVEPPLSPVEMGHAQASWDEITTKLARVRPLELATDLPAPLAQFLGNHATYGPLFAQVFGTSAITRERVGMAIASYERTLVSDQSPFDLGTLTPNQLQGLDAFQNRGNCETCHPSTNKLFTDGKLTLIHLPNHPRAVKTPTLRNVGLRRRFMSGGQITSLDLVLQHYEQIAFFGPGPGDSGALRDFLQNGLTDPRVANRQPPFDRPTLRSERVRFGSNQFGTGVRGSGNVTPVILADCPPFLGNPAFRIGLGRARPNAETLLLMSGAQAAPGTTVLGVPLNVDYRGGVFQVLRTSPTGAGTGTATYTQAIPADPILLGRDYFAQWFVRDFGASAAVSTTRGARFQVFARP